MTCLTLDEVDVVSCCLANSRVTDCLLCSSTNVGMFIGGFIGEARNARFLLENNSQLKKETVDNLVAKMAVVSVPNIQALSNHVVEIASTDRIHEVLADDAWDNLPRQYPNCYGVASVSRVGFDAKQRQALVYMEILRGPTSGGGHWLICEFEGQAWSMSKTFSCWDA